MGKRYLAFRVYGDFLWPPTAPDEANGKSTVRGAVEIHFVDDSPDKVNGEMWACLRWVPVRAIEANKGDVCSSTEDDTAPENIPCIQTLSHHDLCKKFGDGEETVEFRLGYSPDQNGENLKERLLFRGAILFEQFAIEPGVPATDLSSTPDLRWVLARTYNLDKTICYSEVAIGDEDEKVDQQKGSSFRFNLALPTPTPQAVIGNIQNYAIPFSVHYDPVVKKSDYQASKAVDAVTFAAGVRSKDSVLDSEVRLSTTGIKKKYLGGFGFSKTEDDEGFIHFPRIASSDPHHYWMSSECHYRDELLEKLGNMEGLDTQYFRVGDGNFMNRVIFKKDPGRAGRTIIIFRSGINTNGVTHSPTDGDIKTDSSAPRLFSLRNPSAPDQWIKTDSPELLVDLELDYGIKDKEIWSLLDQNASVDAKILVRLGFESKVTKEPGTGDIFLNKDIYENIGKSDSETNTSISDLFDRAIKSMRLARLDLQNIEPLQPQSLLPEISFPNRLKARFALCGTVDAKFAIREMASGDPINRIIWGEKKSDRKAWAGADFRLSLWPDDRNVGDKVAVKVKAEAALPSFVYPPAAPPTKADEFAIELIHDPDAYKARAPEFCQFRLNPGNDSNGKLHGRLGGLEFHTGPDSALFNDSVSSNQNKRGQDYSYWRFGYRPPLLIPTREKNSITNPAKWRGYRATDVDMRLRLSITAIAPIGVDVPWGDRTNRPRPLLIKLDELNDQGAKGKFILDARETISAVSDRQLTAKILDQGNGDAASGRHVVISEEPFSITRFHSQPLQDRGTQDNAIVASYDSDTRTWEVKLAAPHYHYEFPPQAAGESMDKPGRLEIHDPDPNVKYSYPLPPGLEDGVGGVMRRHAVEFRLTPSAELWIRPSDVERGYFLPEWAVYEIFRQRGEFGLGAAMEAFRGEFLYGLTVGIDTNRETGIARGARVAEIEALMGSPPGRFNASTVSPPLAERWDRIYRSIARRPERLEIWARDPSATIPFSQARFETGVNFALRNTAVHRLPLIELEAQTETPADSGKPRFRKHGLSGGALWPLESANFFNRLLESPVSRGGTVDRIALSPNGGDADQKAEFLRGQLAIVSETRNGFVQRHKIEIIGRIAVFWHRAKHVVVYERTVNPSAQFTPVNGGGTRTRRPVLRKVSEYIELLQPVRSYPDFAAGKASSCGFLRSVRFNSVIINVDSAWSEDTGDYGWKIPLWNRHSAMERPQVYPRPDIGFVTAAEGEGDAPLATQECIEPDNIYFFADAKADNADTDSWFSRIGIDCTNLPAPNHGLQRKLNGDDGASDQARLPSAMRIPRGHSRFTWRLAPPSRKTALNAGRSGEPIYAGLESITFMRSSTADAASAPVKEMIAAMKQAAGIDPPVKKLAYWAKDGNAPSELSTLGTALAVFKCAVSNGQDAEIIEKAKLLYCEVLKLPGALKDEKSLDGYLKEAKKYGGKLKDLKALAKEGPSRCEKLVDDFAGSLRRKQLLILDNIRSWEATATDYMPSVGDRFPNKDQLIDKLAEGVTELVAPALDGVVTCCRFGGHRDRLIHATPASRSKSMGLLYPMVECLRVGL